MAADRLTTPAARSSANVPPHMTRVLVIDNYDSFTWNLVHLLGPLARDRSRSCATTRSPASRLAGRRTPSCSRPAPARPNEAGICLDLIRGVARDPDLRGLPRPAGDRPGLRRRGRPGAVADARQGVEVEHRGEGRCSAASTALQGDALPFARRRPRDLPGRSRGDGGDARRLDHGPVASRRCRSTACSSIPRASCRSTARRSCGTSSTRAAWNRAKARRPPPPLNALNRDGQLQALSRQGRDRARADREEARAAFDDLLSGEVTPGPGRRLPDGPAGARRGARRDRRRGLGHARAMLRVERARRTPSTSSAPAATTRAATTSRRSPRSSWPAAAFRSPSTATGRPPPSSGAADVLTALGVKIGLDPARPGALPSRGRLCFMFAPDASRRDAPRGAGAGRARHPHALQPARAAVQPGRRQAPAPRRVLRGLARPLTQVLKELGSSARLDRARLRRARRDHHHRPDLHVVALENGAIRRFTDRRRRRSACRPRRPEDLKGGDPEHNAAQLRAVLDGADAYRDVAVFNAGSRARGRRTRGDLREGVERARAGGRQRRREGDPRAPRRGLEQADELHERRSRPHRSLQARRRSRRQARPRRARSSAARGRPARAASPPHRAPSRGSDARRSSPRSRRRARRRA